MTSNKLEECMRKLEEWVLDEDKIVTYKYLSRTLDIHVNTAKQLLKEYLIKQTSLEPKSVSASYLLAGSLMDGSYIVSIVSEADLGKAYGNFNKITSEHVYSIQKGDVDASLRKNSQILYVADTKLELPQNYPIKFKQCQAVRSVKDVKTEVEEPLMKCVEPSEVFKKEEKVKGIAKWATMESSKENIATIPPVTAPEKRKTEKKASEPSPAKKPASLKAVTHPKSGGRDKKRKRIVCGSDSDSESDKERSEPEPDVEEPEVNVEEPQAIVEEPETEEDMKEAKAEAKEDGNVWRRKKLKKKFIDQTFLLDDGYMQTVKKVVYVTDSEEEEVVKQKESAEKRKNPKAATFSAQVRSDETNKKAQRSKGTAAKKHQSNILSFFKKA